MVSPAAGDVIDEAGHRPARASVVAIGPMPPWITGQSVATAAVVESFRRGQGEIVLVDTAPRAVRSKWLQRASRLPSYLASLTALLARKPFGWAYLVIDADLGMYFNILCAAAARARGSRLVLHYHSSLYVSQTRGRMRALAWVAGQDALHVTQCQAMSEELRRRYPEVRHTEELSNAHVVSAGEPKDGQPAQFTLGHLSNLTLAKGLATVIDTARFLRRAGIDVAVRLAGPMSDGEVAGLIARAQAEMPGRITYDGPLHGARKTSFYKEISAFVFPSTYRNETEGIVILEALAAGTPVVAYGKCCIPKLLAGQEQAGLAVPLEKSFEPAAGPLLIRWATEPASLAAASAAAALQFKRLRAESAGQLTHLLRLMSLPRPATHEAEPLG